MAGRGIRGAIEAQVEVLSPRDKKLLAGLLVFVVTVVLGIGTYTLVSLQRNMESRVRESKQTLVKVQAQQAEYDEVAAMLKAQEARLAQFDGKALSAYVEELAAEMGYTERLPDAQRLEQIETDGLVATKWRISLKGRTYDEAIQFLHRLESNGYPLRIETARFRQVMVKREKAVDLTVEAFTYKVTES